MNEAKWQEELKELDSLIEEKGLKVDKSNYYTNIYDMKLMNKRNEVWRVKMESADQ
jgi:predicted metallo-beta-lactamase superfamily hydrolase